MEKEGKVKKPIFKRWWFWLIVVIIIFGVLGSGGDNDVTEQPAGISQPAFTESQAQQEPDSGVNEQLTFKGTMDLNVVDEKAIMAVNSNVPDGGIFEVAILNGDFDVLSDFIEIKDGKVVKEFIIPNDWNVGYLSGMAMFKFNLDDHPQPNHIKEIYGNKGENMLGDLIVETTIGGYNGNIEPKNIAYPDEATVKAKSADNKYTPEDGWQEEETFTKEDLFPEKDTSEDTQTYTVYITKTGAKYHEGYCRYLKSSKIPIELNDAKVRGYTPCKVCGPPY